MSRVSNEFWLLIRIWKTIIHFCSTPTELKRHVPEIIRITDLYNPSSILLLPIDPKLIHFSLKISVPDILDGTIAVRMYWTHFLTADAQNAAHLPKGTHKMMLADTAMQIPSSDDRK